MRKQLWITVLGAVLCTLPALAQQTGSIAGRVTTEDGDALPGVVVEASSDVLPRPRTVTTLSNGSYIVPQLPPDTYVVTFSLAGMDTLSREVTVSLDQETALDVTMGLETVAEEIVVVARSPLLDRSSTEIRSGISEEELELLPVAQEYRDLQKLIPGVQYSEETVRGPSAGGSGQDNVYQFDGVNVNLPLFGVLSAEPSNHDVEQVSIVKGGAKAVDFNRSGGFTIDTLSKSGTGSFHGEASFQIQTADMTGSQDVETVQQFDEDRDWTTASLGGPIVPENLYFYTSYYRPTRERANSANAFGPRPDFQSERDELFGKLTWTPTGSVLLNASYRDSDREEENASIGTFATPSTAVSDAATLKIGIAEGSWVINDRNFLSFKYTDFENETGSVPDNLLGIPIALDGSMRLDVNNLDQQGHLFVPNPIPGEDAFNDFIDPLIQRFGFLEDGVRQGGSDVGVHHEINDQDFSRESFQVGYDTLFGDRVSHDLHVGYQWFSDEEELRRTSNGWGIINVTGGRSSFEGQPVFYEARLFASGLGLTPAVRTEYESHNIEINDTIRWKDWAFNVGVLLSQDTLYGQGLREDPSRESGFAPAPGNKYEMHKIDWEDLIQPRLGATWAYNERDTVFASYARYNPTASSLPRAAAWDRFLFLRTVDAFFDAEGDLIGVSQVAGSTGKLFQAGIEPRYVDEYMIGTARQLSSRWTARAYARHRYANNFWEDTNNNARVNFEPPPGIPRELYVPPNDLVGTGSYVVAQLDNAFTKFYEVSLEADGRVGNASLRGSYTWSHYYGTFDQDNTTGLDNDAALFIGSSNIADGAGRQMWDNKYGDLRGDRRHLLKLYGAYRLPWNASAGAFGVYQSGQPWELQDFLPYSHLTSSTIGSNRFAEPAGSRKSSDHYQIDLNYTQNIPFGGRYNVQLVGELFNLTDKQTGYDIQPVARTADFGEPRRFYRPRRFQLALRFQF